MNERIKELAEQAAIFAETEYAKQTIATFDTNKSTQELYEEKFAKLIVRECALQCVHNEDMDRIEKHFGVEQ